MAWVRTRDGRILDTDDDEGAAAFKSGDASPYSAEETPTAPLRSAFPVTAADALAPRNAAAQREGKPFGARLFASGEDLATLPLRGLAGLANYATGGSFEEGMARPVETAEKRMEPGFARGVATGYGGMAESPLTLPLAGLGGLRVAGQALNPIGQGLLASLASYGVRGTEQSLGGEKPSMLPTGGDMLPAVIGTGAQGVQGMPTLQGKALGLIRSIIKPSSVGDEAEGLMSGLSAPGMFRKLIGYGTNSAPAIAKNYETVAAPVLSKFEPLKAEMDATGVMIPVSPSIRGAAMSAKEGTATGGLGIDPDEIRPAMDWYARRVAAPTDAENIGVWEGEAAPQSVTSIPPSVAHNRKSSILRRAFREAGKKNQSEGSEAIEDVAMAGGKILRQQLAGRFPAYAQLMDESAPIMSMEDAMARAASRANRNPFSLGAIANPFSTIQETPATARLLYDLGALGKATAPAASTAVAPLSAYLQSRQGR